MAHQQIRASDVDLVRFFGFGNETVATSPQVFWNPLICNALFQPWFRFGLDHLDVRIGPTAKFSHTMLQADHFLAVARPYGVADFGPAGVGLSLLWDTRNHLLAATRGAMLYAEGNFYPAVWSTKSAFGEVHGATSAFLSP